MILLLKIIKKILEIKYALIKRLPIRDKITIVSRQSDEPSLDIEMLCKELKIQKPNTHIVVLCKAMEGGLWTKVGYGFHLIRQMYHVGTSKIVIADSYCISISMFHQRKELKVVQMWHALGALKKFGKSIVGNEGEGRDKRLAEIMNIHGNYTDIIVSSAKCKEAYQEAFGYDQSHLKVGSLPRVDKILNKEFQKEIVNEVYAKYPEFKDKKLIVYAPTFRTRRNIDKEIQRLIDEMDEDNFILVVKKHPLMTINPGTSKSIVIDEEFSTMEMMMTADYVICDYSAVVFEGALMEKPLFFYAPDLDEYKSERTFYMDYEKAMPGVVSKDAREIMTAIANDDFDMKKIKKFAVDYIEIQDECTEKIVKTILS